MKNKMNIKNNRVFGFTGINCKNANWNADWSNFPRTLSNGNYIASDKALKYAIRKYWENDSSKKVMYFKDYKITEKGLQPLDLAEKFEKITGIPLPKEKKDNKKEIALLVLNNLFPCVDVMNFGATFAENGANISITGCVQFSQGINLFSDTNTEILEILSPFRNSNDKSETKNQTTAGTMVIVDEANYYYDLIINPSNYKQYIELNLENFNGYTEEAYNSLKDGLLYGPTALNSCTKTGCETDIALFVNMKDGDNTVLPSFSQLLTLTKENKKNILDLTKLMELLKNNIEHVENIEIFYNKNNLELIGIPNDLEVEIKSLY